METSEILEAEERTLYELERGKPLPSQNHGLIQGNLTIMLGINYRQQYSFLTELTLSFSGKNYVPDLCIYQKKSFNP